MKIYGLLGKKISYSLSPSMHNEAFKALKMDAEYRIFDIPENELDDFFLTLRNGTLSGCNVTIPYKEKAIEHVDICDDLAEEIGAINTIATRDGKLFGYNTDCRGFIETLKGKKPGDLDFNPKGKIVFIFGAGGAARSVVYGLMDLGARRIAIADIDMEKCERLASGAINKHKGDSLITVVKEESKYEEFVSKSDLLVNATGCGIKDDDPPLFDYKHIQERLYVIDLIYAKDTPLVKEARSRGAKAVNGANMLLYQAIEAFRIWTGAEPPVEVMREALLGKLRDNRQ